MRNLYANDNISNNSFNSAKKSKTHQGLTPRELIRYHIDNPDEPIKDEDIENLVLHIPHRTLSPIRR